MGALQDARALNITRTGFSRVSVRAHGSQFVARQIPRFRGQG